MKNYRNWFVAGVGILTLVALSCIPIEPEPGVPQNLTLAAGTDGASVVLTWQAPTETVDGYNIYFSTTSGGAGTKIGSTTNLTYTDAAPTQAGYYYATSYTGTTESGKSNEVNDVPVEGTNTGSIMEFSGPDPSGYGWSTTGVGNSYAWADAAQADIFLYGGTSTEEALYIYSATQNPWGGTRNTDIVDMGSNSFDGVTLAPETGYFTGEAVTVGHVYFLWNVDNHLIKIRCEAVTGTFDERVMTFKYAYQTLAGFRLF